MDPDQTPCSDADGPPPPNGAVRVLLIDDDRDDYLLTKEIIRDIPNGTYRLDYIPAFAEGVEAICRAAHDVYLVDYLLGARTGIDLITTARERGCVGPIIIMTGKGQHDIDRAAMRAGASDYLEKATLTPTLLERSIRYAIAQSQVEARLERLVRDRTAELARANDRLREADRRKDEFLAALGHELRNPLAPIRNALEIMRLKPDGATVAGKQRERLDRQVGQLVRLVEELLDVSRVTTGKLRIQPENLPLAEVLDAAIDASRPLFAEAGVELVVEPPDEPVVVHGDRVRLTQVFSNLLNNAAKYTDSGGRAKLSTKRSPRDRNRVEVRLRDTGVGIPPVQLPRVFELFTQLDRVHDRAQGGLGVGLALVKHLVELHDGTVSVHSEGTNKGTEFVVTLNVAR